MSETSKNPVQNAHAEQAKQETNDYASESSSKTAQDAKKKVHDNIDDVNAKTRNNPIKAAVNIHRVKEEGKQKIDDAQQEGDKTSNTQSTTTIQVENNRSQQLTDLGDKSKKVSLPLNQPNAYDKLDNTADIAANKSTSEAKAVSNKAEQIAVNASNKLKQTVHKTKDATEDTIENAKQIAEDAISKAKQAAANISTKVKDSAQSLQNKVQSTAESAKDATSDGASTFKENIKQLRDNANERAHTVKESIVAGAQQVKDTVSEKYQSAKDSVANTTEKIEQQAQEMKQTANVKLHDLSKTVKDVLGAEKSEDGRIQVENYETDINERVTLLRQSLAGAIITAAATISGDHIEYSTQKSEQGETWATGLQVEHESITATTRRGSDVGFEAGLRLGHAVEQMSEL